MFWTLIFFYCNEEKVSCYKLLSKACPQHASLPSNLQLDQPEQPVFPMCSNIAIGCPRAKLTWKPFAHERCFKYLVCARAHVCVACLVATLVAMAINGNLIYSSHIQSTGTYHNLASRTIVTKVTSL